MHLASPMGFSVATFSAHLCRARENGYLHRNKFGRRHRDESLVPHCRRSGVNEIYFSSGFSTFLINSSRAGIEAARHSRLNDFAFLNAQVKRSICFCLRRSS
jgi:hypothetical protein